MLSALRRLRSPPAAPAGVRFMSGHSIEHAIAETEKWKKISFLFLPVVGAYGIFTMIRHFQHDHHAHSVSGDEPDRVLYPYINIRNKPLPWSLTDKAILGRGSNCALFDYECAKKERAAAAAAAAAAE
mmetsp:Transcript_39610/g.79170  ORF Transcript_39610/g.79170 Transcript_39610/m.79170 type:complete len:128 (-) Transcript_39610:487-870(-)